MEQLEKAVKQVFLISAAGKFVNDKSDKLSFVKIEILFRLCERINELDHPEKAYKLLSGQAVIFDTSDSKRLALLSHARLLLQSLKQAHVFKSCLEKYQKTETTEKIYSINGDKLCSNIESPYYKARCSVYDQVLDAMPAPAPEKKISWAKANTPYVIYNNQQHSVDITFDETDFPFLPVKKISEQREATIEPITATITEILEGAQELDTKAKGKDSKTANYRKQVLEKNIYTITNGTLNPAASIKIDNVFNIAGQVAAGKTTFAESLIATLLKQNKRIVYIVPTVNKILDTYTLFSPLCSRICTLIGTTGKFRHIDAILNEHPSLKKQESQILQQPCRLNSQIIKDQDIIEYGDEPCRKLYKKNDDGTISNYPSVCPYYNVCPATLNDRSIPDANLVITTLYGLCECSFGADHRKFLNYAAANFDLIIIDEADDMMCRCDDIFSPTIGINDYLSGTLSYLEKYSTKTLLQKSNDKTGRLIYAELNNIHTAMINVYAMIKGGETGWDKNSLRNFSSISLIYKLKVKKELLHIPEGIFRMFNALSQTEINQDKEVWEIESIIRGQNNADFLLDIFLDHCRNRYSLEDGESFDAMENNTKEKILFILELIGLESIYQSLSRLVESSPDIPMEVRRIMSRTMTSQQQLLPDAPCGNILAFESQGDDIYIKKQFGYGRLFASRLPWLITDNDGNPNGAHVMLMSGTGYIPGSYRFHTGDKIDLIIQADNAKRTLISKAKVYTVSSDICVSGSPEEEKNTQLIKLTEQNANLVTDLLDKKEKLLIIVNSYDQCRPVADKLKEHFLASHKEYNISFVVPDSTKVEEHASIQHMTLRKNITQFRDDVLVAPACIIERGFNIVYDDGNAVFDDVLFMVRPMTNPSDFSLQMEKVNGKLLSKYRDMPAQHLLSTIESLQRDAFEAYYIFAQYSQNRIGLRYLPKEMKTDAIASLFVTIVQVFGRLCRIGSKPKNNPPKLYFLDGAFSKTDDEGSTTLSLLDEYLDFIMQKSTNHLAAETLYYPIYKAIKERRPL